MALSPSHLADVPNAIWEAISLSADGQVVLLNFASAFCEYVSYNRVTRQPDSFRVLPQISGNTCSSSAWLHPGGRRALFAVSKFNYISGESESFVLRWTA